MTMKMTMAEFVGLEPCPFCGGEATVERIGKSGYFYIACNTAYCCDFGRFDTESEAITAWNSRAERTCRMETAEGCHNWNSCSECDADYYTDQPINYCPNCGCKVVSE